MTVSRPSSEGRVVQDPATFDVIKNALSMLCDEMATTLTRAAYSPLVRQTLDCASGILAANCDAIAQGRTTPLHMMSLMTAARAVLRSYDTVAENDVYLVNDPFDGGSHLPDLFLIKPVFHEGQPLFFVGSEAHHADMGGRVAGSSAADSREIFEEGLRLPAARLVREGVRDQFVLDVIARNVRLPHQVIGDLEAQLAALEVGEAGLHRLIARYGRETLLEYVDALLDYAEHRAREEIESWPDGTYAFEDWIDDDGAGSGPIRIAVTARVERDELKIDFAGTAPQVPAALNLPESVTVSSAMVAVRAAMAGDIPHNAGYMRPISVSVPEGSILNPMFPAAVAARVLASYRTVDAVIGCLAQFVPHRAMAASDGGNTLATFAGAGRTEGRFVWSDIHVGSWGAREDRDGIDGICNISIAIANTPAEVIEREMPMRICRYEFVSDTGGAGRFRGGLAVAREYEVEGETMLQIRSDRNTVAPFGLAGGQPGAFGQNVVSRGTERRLIPSKTTFNLQPGEVYRSQQAGGGGWGDPFDRDPERVWEDVLDEKITRAFAEREHGVVIGEDGLDLPATKRLRAELRRGDATDVAPIRRKGS
jgi:N-methylhydantoinase B